MNIKGLYIIWGDPYYIDRCIDSGINTLLVANQHLTPEEDEQRIPHWGSYKNTIDILTRYRGQVKLVLVPLYMKFWGRLEPHQMFLDAGYYRQKTPCPTSFNWVTDRLKKAEKICHEYGADLVMDVEGYGASVDKDILNLGSGKYWPKYFCDCERCEIKTDGKVFKKIHQWNIHNQYNRMFFKKYRISGQLLNTNHWTFSRYSDKPYIFLEGTYPMGSTKKWNLMSKLFQAKKWEYINRYIFRKDAHYVPGVWLERFKEDEFFDYLAWLRKYYDSFWIYSQSRLSKYSPYHADQTRQPNPYYHKVVSPSFFKQLKQFC